MKPVDRIVVRATSRGAKRGRVHIGPLTFNCALGRSGIKARKREGDGATPSGRWLLLDVLYRRDQGPRPVTSLPTHAIAADDGWCDAPTDRNYNRPVRLPYRASYEHLWRADRVYDVVVVLDHNRKPRRRFGGSAIFMHVARPGYLPTEGCVALAERDLRRLLSRIGPRTWIVI